MKLFPSRSTWVGSPSLLNLGCPGSFQRPLIGSWIRLRFEQIARSFALSWAVSISPRFAGCKHITLPSPLNASFFVHSVLMPRKGSTGGNHFVITFELDTFGKNLLRHRAGQLFFNSARFVTPYLVKTILRPVGIQRPVVLLSLSVELPSSNLDSSCAPLETSLQRNVAVQLQPTDAFLALLLSAMPSHPGRQGWQALLHTGHFPIGFGPIQPTQKFMPSKSNAYSTPRPHLPFPNPVQLCLRHASA